MNYITDYSFDELTALVVKLGGKKFTAKQIWSWLYKKNTFDFDEMSDISIKIRERLKEMFSENPYKKIYRQVSKDGTEKFLLTLRDGNSIEAVLIPEKNRMTICVSCQVGCKFGCEFCATGKMGYTRSLTAGEIIFELLILQKHCGKRITNIVYMGMGEPFDNYDNVIKSADIANDDRGLAIGARKITISTVGVIPGIERFIADDVRYRLALSLHNPDDAERSLIMPANKIYPVEKLIEILRKYTEKSKRKVVFEYVVIDGVNDTQEHALKLKKMLNSLPSKLNLIRLHANSESKLKCSNEKQQDRFYRSLQGNSFPVVFRASRGEDISAACGQLKVEQEKL